MTTAVKHTYRRWLYLIPLVGILLFVGLFTTAAIVYPGGYTGNPSAKGFSILHNYWCELLSGTTKNGAVNPSRPLAIAATISLAIGLSVFWYLLPRIFYTKNRYQPVIQFMGIVSMLSLLVLFTDYHDTAINVAGGSGILALVLTFRELYSSRRIKLFWWGLACFALILINSIVYYTGFMIAFLPVIQKVTLLICLSCFGWVTVSIYQHTLKQSTENP